MTTKQLLTYLVRKVGFGKPCRFRGSKSASLLQQAVMEVLEPRLMQTTTPPTLVEPTGLDYTVSAYDITDENTTTVPVDFTWKDTNDPNIEARAFLEIKQTGSAAETWFTLAQVPKANNTCVSFATAYLSVDATYQARIRVFGVDTSKVSSSISVTTPGWNELEQGSPANTDLSLTDQSGYTDVNWNNDGGYIEWNIYQRSANQPFTDLWSNYLFTDPSNTDFYGSTANYVLGYERAQWLMGDDDVAITYGDDIGWGGPPEGWGSADQAFRGSADASGLSLDPPIDVNGTYNSSSGVVTLSWDAVEDASYYTIYNAVTGEPVDLATTSDTTIEFGGGNGTDRSLVRDGYYVVVPFDDFGYAGQPSSVIDMSQAYAPEFFNGIRVNKGKSVALTWDDAAYNETGYEIQRRTGPNSTWVTVETTGADTATWTDPNVKKAQKYDYRIRAIRDDPQLNSNWANVTQAQLLCSTGTCGERGIGALSPDQPMPAPTDSDDGALTLANFDDNSGVDMNEGVGIDGSGDVSSTGIPDIEQYFYGSETTVQIGAGDDTLYWVDTGSGFVGSTGNPFGLSYSTANGTRTYTVTDSLGAVLTMKIGVGAAEGCFDSYIDSIGNKVWVTSVATNGKPAQIRQDLLDGHYETYNYTYGTTGDLDGKLTSITLNRDGSSTPTESMTLEYYGSGDSYGNPGDLKTVTHNTSTGGTSVSYIRHSIINSTSSTVQYVVMGSSYDRLVADHPDVAGTSDISAYADLKYSFDSAGRVTSLVAQGNGCSLCTGGFGTTAIAYATSSLSDDVNTWKNKKVETLPGYDTNHTDNSMNAQVITYSNYLGEPILVLTVQNGTGQTWADFYRYDSIGNQIVHATSSAIMGYDESKSDLVGWTSPSSNLIRDNSGLIEYTDYTHLGTGYFVQDSYVTQGDGGAGSATKYYQGYSDYTSHSYNGTTVYKIEDSVTFPLTVSSSPGTGSTGARVTHYDYTWQMNGTNETNTVASIVTTMPTVSTGNNGPNVADVTKQYFDQYGRTIWTMDGDGFVNYTAYDPVTGAVVKTIHDVQYSSLSGGEQSSFDATGWSHHTTGLNLVTTYAVDDLGRTTAMTDPAGNLTYTVYDDAHHAVFTFPGATESVNGGGNGTLTTTGPITMTRTQIPYSGGLYNETLTFSGTVTVTSHNIVLPGWDNRGTSSDSALLNLIGNATSGSQYTLQSLSRTLSNGASQVVESDAYFNIDNTTYLATAVNSAYSGSVNTNFYATTYGYNVRGESALTISPTGTITITTYDVLGRQRGTYVGTDATPSSDLNGSGGSPNWEDFIYGVNAAATTIPGGTDMTLVSLNQYDFGGVGDGDLTASMVYPSGPSAPRITQYDYDWRDRLISTKAGISTASLPGGWSDNDINSPYWAGTVNFDGATFVAQGGGSGFVTGATSDQFSVVSETMSGNTTLIARVGSLTNVGSGTEAGLMLRDSTSAGALSAEVVITPTGGVSFIWRSTANSNNSSTVVSNIATPEWLKLVRSSNSFSAYYSSNGSSWTQIGTSHTVAMTSSAVGGLVVTGGSNATQATARFDNVSVNSTNIVASSWEADSVHRPLTVATLNNLGEQTAIARYDGDGQFMVDKDADGIPDGLSSSTLRAYSTTSYDEQGRPFRSTTYSVDPSNGTYQTSSTYTVVSDTWYDHRGNVIATHTSGGPMSKMTFDGAGRLTISYVTDGGAVNNTSSAGTILSSWSNASSINNDIVLSQVEYTYDADGNVILTTERERFHDDSSSAKGALLGPTDTTGHAARVSYMASYYDAGNRMTATVNVGTNGGTTYSRPGSAATSSTDTLLLTTYGYNAAGEVETVADPAGIIAKTYYDQLGRTTRTVANYVDGTPSSSDDQTTLYTYDGVNHILTLTADMPSGSDDQVTQYVYGITTGQGSAITSNDILQLVKYPDPSTGAASSSAAGQNSFTYDALGELITKIDQNGSTHTYGYDPLGRQTSDSVTLPAGNTWNIDTTVLRIETSYNSQGLVDKITSYSSATGGSGAIVNQIADVYNGLGQLTKEYQEHNGAVNTGTSGTSLSVSYAYSNPDHGSRITSMTYPSGTVLNYNYGTANGTNDVISRLDNLSETNGNVTTTLESYSYLGLGTVVKRAHPEDGVDLTYIKQVGESNGDAGDQYIGLDRFGRVVDQRWINANGTDVDRYTYTYDRDSNVTSKENEVAWHAPLIHSDFYEAYTYDGLNRITSTDRYNGSTHDQTWDLDALGNMNSVTTNSVAENRTYNDQNQLTGMGNNTLTFDNDGSVTTDDHGYTLKYDAWNRLAQVKNGNTTQMTYAYDGEGRRIGGTDGNNTKTDNYYSSQWQNLEQRTGVSYGNAGSISSQYVYSPVYVDAIVLRDRDSDGNGTLDQRIYATQDVNFNVTGLISNGGTVLQRYVYNSWGNFDVKDSGWNGSSDGYAWVDTFQGLFYDAATGYFYDRHRDTSPTMMRAAEPEPSYGMPYVDGLNLYPMYDDNPINLVDPMGLAAGDINMNYTWTERLVLIVSGAQDFVRGAAGSLSFGLSDKAREGIYGDAGEVTNKSAYTAGEWTEVGIELAVTGGSAAMKRAAANAVAREIATTGIRAATRAEAEAIARKQITARMRSAARRIMDAERGPGDIVHHVNTLVGHPSIPGIGNVRSAWPTLGVPGFANSRIFNLTIVGSKGAHDALHIRAFLAEAAVLGTTGRGAFTGLRVLNNSVGLPQLLGDDSGGSGQLGLIGFPPAPDSGTLATMDVDWQRSCGGSSALADLLARLGK